MQRPEFTAEEQYLISALFAQGSWWSRYSDLLYLLPVAALLFIGAVIDAPSATVIAFVTIVGYRLGDFFQQRRFEPCWRSIIDKYEAALASAEEPAAHSADSVTELNRP